MGFVYLENITADYGLNRGIDMRYRIRATYNDETFEFNLYDHARWLTLLYKTAGIALSANHVFLKYPLEFVNVYMPSLVGHEAIHVLQARRMKWKYLPTYVLQAIKAKFIKRNIPMEQEAYGNEHLVTWNIVM
jgi:hypothetical protein